MKTLSVKLPDGLDARLTAAARRRKTTKSSLVRKTLQEVLREQGHAKRGSALDVVAPGKLMTRYADVPMSLAGACLVRMIERQPDATVLTLDRDFRVDRSHGRRVIPALMPSDI